MALRLLRASETEASWDAGSNPDAGAETPVEAGVATERYQEIVYTVERVVAEYRSMNMVADLPPIDTAGMPEEARTEVREQIELVRAASAEAERAFDGLDPETVQAFKERMARLDTLVIQLAFARVRAVEQ